MPYVVLILENGAIATDINGSKRIQRDSLEAFLVNPEENLIGSLKSLAGKSIRNQAKEAEFESDKIYYVWVEDNYYSRLSLDSTNSNPIKITLTSSQLSIIGCWDLDAYQIGINAKEKEDANAFVLAASAAKPMGTAELTEYEFSVIPFNPSSSEAPANDKASLIEKEAPKNKPARFAFIPRISTVGSILRIIIFLAVGLPVFLTATSIGAVTAGLVLIGVSITIFSSLVIGKAIRNPFNRVAASIGAYLGVFAMGAAAFYLAPLVSLAPFTAVALGLLAGTVVGAIVGLGIARVLNALGLADPAGLSHLYSDGINPIAIILGIIAGALLGAYALPMFGPLVGALAGAAILGISISVVYGIYKSFDPSADVNNPPKIQAPEEMKTSFSVFEIRARSLRQMIREKIKVTEEAYYVALRKGLANLNPDFLEKPEEFSAAERLGEIVELPSTSMMDVFRFGLSLIASQKDDKHELTANYILPGYEDKPITAPIMLKCL